MQSLQNKCVLITGASSGFGLACAEKFAQAGARVLMCARRADTLKVLTEQLQKTYQAQVHYFQCDVRNQVDIREKLVALPKDWHQVDILINNAGLASGAEAVQAADTADWDTMIDINIKGLLYMTREIIPQMLARQTGHVINMGSIASHEVYPLGVVYAATKHAVFALSKGLRMDLLGSNIRVSQISPGAAETEFSIVRYKGDEAAAKKVYAGFIPLSAEDVADAVLYAASCPPHVNISEIVIMPTAQAAAKMIARRE